MPRSARARRTVIGLGFALAWAVAPAPRATAAPRGGPAKAPLLYYRSRAFRIPVTVQPENRSQIREVRLWTSDDEGFSWRLYSRTTPDRPEFSFRGARDTAYWFAVQTVDRNGRVYPDDNRTVEPSLKVIVDTVSPTIVLEPRPRRGSLATVRWEVQDEHIVLRSLTLEYQAGAGDWRKVPLREGDYALLGAKTWDAGTADPIRVRASIRDRAHNVRQVEVTLGDGLAAPPGPAPDLRDLAADAPPPIAPISNRAVAGQDGAAEGESPAIVEPPPAVAEAGAGGSAPGEESSSGTSAGQTLLVGSPRFGLRYAVEDAGPSGPSLVELWVTRDGGRTWSRQPEDTDRVSPYPVDLGGEGTFGLWLVVQGASGLGDPPPAPGDRPQMWVEVDSTPPVVQLDPPRVGTGAQAGKVFLSWRASDPHLAPRSVTIAYRPDRPGAGWQPIAGPIANTGHYEWPVPATVPPRFHVRVEVADTLGNRNAAETTDTGPVLVDRTRPRGRILGLDPAAQVGSDLRSRR